ncbi:hypothetical protein AN958_02138 [Leucoagaricus sp. SymC.cos]|nr:hypothetical protein AN958_02138 [Leucoagaricus sp. SymC.cos]
MVSRPPSDLPLGPEGFRPSSIQRTNSNPSPQIPQKDSLVHKTSSMGILSLKKRPSTFTLPNPLTPIPPPLQSPASKSDYSITRSRSVAPESPPPLPQKSSSRPSTASSREDVTPWEVRSTPSDTAPTSPIDDKFEKALTPTLKSKPSSIKSKPPSLKSAHQPSLRSRTSSTATGLVEDVTPWELYPPIPEKNTKYHHPTETIPEYVPPLNSPPPLTATGFVEDVTPWELVPPPPPSQDSLAKLTSRSPSYLASVGETSTLLSFDSSSHNNRKLPSPAPPSTHNSSHVSGTSSQEHKMMKTGPTEDVTPWELEPGPRHGSTIEDGTDTRTTRLRSSLTLSQVEKVTPWELHPAPPSPPLDNGAKDAKTAGSRIKKKTSNSGNSFASNSGKALSDLSFVRGRKNGIKTSRVRYTNESLQSRRPHSPVQNILSPSQDQSDDNEGDDMPRHVHSRIPEIPPTPRGANNATSPTTSTPITPVTPVTSKLTRSEPSSRPQFNMSTADRKILTQLEYFKDAHDKEFIIKGKGYHQQGGGVTPGKIHHTYDEKEAPYPRCYDARAQDFVSFVFVASKFAFNGVFECHFWGIDLVPTQPDFTTLGDRDLKERVHWVHQNFLEGLPFEEEKFDYIHIKRVGLGVPENKWDALFEECKRVLKPGGAFELIEEDLFFPGKPKDSHDLPSNIPMALEEPEFSYGFEPIKSDEASHSQPISPISPADIKTPLSTSGRSLNGNLTTSASDQTPVYPTPLASDASASSQEAGKHAIFTNGGPKYDKDSLLPLQPDTPCASSSQPVKVPIVTPHSRSAAKPSLYVKTNTQGHTFAGSAVSLIHAIGHHTTRPNEYTGSAPRRRSAAIVVNKDLNSSDNGAHSRRDSSHGTQSQISSDSIPAASARRPAKSEPYLLKQYKASRNPRDHTLLEAIYTEMLASRFINATPLSIIQNYLDYHFADVRTHPPLLFSFPPTALLHSESRYVTDSETESESSDEFSSDDEARDAIRPKPPRPKVPKNIGTAPDLPRSRYRCVLGKPTEDAPHTPRFVSFPHLIRQQSPYVSFDTTRGYAFSPSSNVQRRSVDGKPSGPMRMSKLPNQTLNLDVKTLNMHLYLRTMDILGCSEPMWEWVVQYQSDLAKKTSGPGSHTSPLAGLIKPIQSDASLSSTASADSRASVMNGIAELTRDDFEMLLVNFELDMQDQASVDYALQEQVNWHVFASPRDPRRKAFDESCKKWDKWVAKQERRAHYLAHHHSRNHNGETSQEPRHRNSNGDLLSVPSAGISNGTAPNHNTDPRGKRFSSKQDLSDASPIPFGPSSLPPDKRLSRAIRIFVAWKPHDPHSTNKAVPTCNGLNTPGTPSH